MALTDAEARKAVKRDKPYKIADSGGLFLHIAKSGTKTWRMKFTLHGREKLLTFGPYPDVKLTEARDKRDEARRQLRENVDPSGARKRAVEAKAAAQAQAAQGETFEAAARRWYDLQQARWARVHASDVITSLERDVFPAIGARGVTEIDTPLVLTTLRAIEDRGSIETAKRLRQRVAAVFAMLKAEGVVRDNPAEGINDALKPLPKRRRQPALIDPDEARQVLIAAEGSGASPVTKLASRFLSLTQARPGMVRGTEWAEIEGIDWDDKLFGPFLPVWRVPARRMKLILDLKDEEGFEHIVPLCAQAVEILRAVRRLTGRNKLVFPGKSHAHKPLSENALGYLYNRLGFHGRHVPHGWRSTFSTYFNELAKKRGTFGDSDVVELMLAHVPENKVKAAYDRAGHMERRRVLSQEWGDLICKGLKPANDLLDGPRRD